MEKFNKLLHQISSALDPKDLENLIHICRIEESRRAAITSGHHLFDHLRHDCRISEDNVVYLKKILNTIKRRDLVHRVERFEGLETADSGGIVVEADPIPEPTTSPKMNPLPKPNQPDNFNRGFVVEGSSAMWGDTDRNVQILVSEGILRPCCVVYCPCVKMSCYKIHFCYVILIVLFLLAIIITSLFWYANVPKVSEHLNTESSTRNSGKFIVIALIVTFPIFLLIVFFARKYWKNRHDAAVVYLNASTPRTITRVRNVGTMAKSEDLAPPVVAQINPNCELEINDVRRTSGRYVRNLTTGDTEPMLST